MEVLDTADILKFLSASKVISPNSFRQNISKLYLTTMVAF